MSDDRAVSIVQKLQLVSKKEETCSCEIVNEQNLEELKIALVNCLITCDNRKQRLFVDNALNHINNSMKMGLKESDLIGFLNCLLHFDEWKRIEDHIQCLKFFLMNNRVVEFLKNYPTVLSFITHYVIETTCSYSVREFSSTHCAIPSILELQSLLSLIHSLLRFSSLSDDDRVHLISFLKEVIEKAETPFLIPFVTSCCSLLIKVDNQRNVTWSDLHLSDNRLIVVRIYSEVKQYFKQLLKEPVSDSSVCESFYHSLITITLTTTDMITKQFLLMLWDLFLQLLPVTHSSLSPETQKQLVDYTTDFAVSLSSHNNRGNISKDLFNHLLPQLPLLSLSSYSYTSLLHYLTHYHSINSNLSGVILLLIPYIDGIDDFIEIMNFIISSVFSARVKSDMLSLLEILLQKIPSNSLSLLLDKAIQAGCLHYDIEFRTLYQKQAQKGFLFLMPYFMKCLDSTNRDYFIYKLTLMKTPSIDDLKRLPSTILSCLLSAIYSCLQLSASSTVIDSYKNVVYENRGYFFTHHKQIIRVLSYQISVMCADSVDVFCELMRVPVIKNNSTYIESYKESLKTLLSHFQTSLFTSIDSSSIDLTSLLLQTSSQILDIPSQFSTNQYLLIDTLLVGYLKEHSCEENSLVTLQVLLQTLSSQITQANTLVLFLLTSYITCLMIHRDGKTRNYANSLFSLLPSSVFDLFDSFSMKLFFTGYVSFFIPLYIHSRDMTFEELVHNPDYQESEFVSLYNALSESSRGWSAWEKTLISCRLGSSRVFIYSCGIQLELARLQRGYSPEGVQDVWKEYVEKITHLAFEKQPSQPTLASLLLLLQMILKKYKNVSIPADDVYCLLPLIVANCFRNLAISSGQGKQAIDLEGKEEDLNEMVLPADISSFLSSPSLSYQQSFLAYAIQIIQTTALVSGNSNCGEEASVEYEEDGLLENEGPKAVDVVSNWEGVKEGISLLIQLTVSRDIDESTLYSICQLIIEIGSNSLHQGILQQVHFALIELLSYYYSHFHESQSFLRIIAVVLSIPVSIHLPIIRRSAGLPFMIHAVLTVLNQFNSSLLAPIIEIMVQWTEEVTRLPVVFMEQYSMNESVKQFLEYYSNTIHPSSTQYETDNVRSRNNRLSLLVHSLNILKSLISSPELTNYFHDYYILLLERSLLLLDHSNWNVKSAAAQLLACVMKRVFRARRSKGENERINRVSDIAIIMEFPRLREVLLSLLKQSTESSSRGVFATLLLFQRVNRQSEEDRELLELLYPYLCSSQYLVRQAACRSIPAVIPVSSIRKHLLLLPDEIDSQYSTHDVNTFCGLIQLMETYIRYLIAGNEERDIEFCYSVFNQVGPYLLKSDSTLVQMHIMQMIECIVNQDIILNYNDDDLQNVIQDMNDYSLTLSTTILSESMQSKCGSLIMSLLIPYMSKVITAPHYNGDKLFALKNCLKCISTLLIHFSKENRDSILPSLFSALEKIVTENPDCRDYYSTWCLYINRLF